MRVLLISTYELGHQPLHVASPAAMLRAAGHEVAALDLAVQPWAPEAVQWAEAVALSVPMHTAMRLALRAAERIRRARPGLPLCFYGLYAPVSQELSMRGVADRVLAGEYEPGLLAWVDGLSAGAPPRLPVVALGRGRARFHTPARDLLPPLERYARLAVNGSLRLAAAVEATHGCRHQCRHCPLPTVYGGAFRVVGEDAVLADVAQLFEAGAEHITFADPDFLNGPAHALRIVRALHRRWPGLTFDVTVKVSHILAHAGLWPELAASGCLFAVTAVECLNDAILGLLDKGHTAADAVAAVRLLRAHGVAARPSLLPFTPWTRPADVAAIVDFVAAEGLIGAVDPVQYTIRLLLPPGSLLLERIPPELRLGGYDAERLAYPWRSADPAADALQRRLLELVGQHADEDAEAVFAAVRALVYEAAGLRPDPIPAGSVEARPHLTEAWFC